MNVETSYSGSTAVAVVDGRIDSANAKDFDEELSAIIDRGVSSLVVDCGGLNYISSAGTAGSADCDQEDERGRRGSGAVLRSGSHPRSARSQWLRAPYEGFRYCRRGAGQPLQVAGGYHQGSPPALPRGTGGGEPAATDPPGVGRLLLPYLRVSRGPPLHGTRLHPSPPAREPCKSRHPNRFGGTSFRRTCEPVPRPYVDPVRELAEESRASAKPLKPMESP